MAKTAIVLFLMAVLAVGFSQNLGGAGNESGTGTGIEPENPETTPELLRERTMEQIQTREQERLQDGSGDGTQVRAMTTTRSMLGASDIAELARLETGPQGQKIAEVATQLNQSVRAMVQAEERVQTRSTVMKFFFGSDRSAVRDMETYANQTREKIAEMESYMNGVTDEEVRAMIQERIQTMNADLETVGQKIQTEKKTKGLFGFLFGQ